MSRLSTRQSKMSQSDEKTKIRINRKRVIRMAEQYRCPPGEENPDHKGQLYFLRGLFTSSIAVSGKPSRQWRGFLSFVDETILENDAEVLGFFDIDRNMEAFVRTAPVDADSCMYCRYDSSFGYPPILLLEKARKVQERYFLEYVEEVGAVRTQDIDPASNKELSRKERAYQNWLFSLAFYEICVLEYYSRLAEEETAPDQAEDTAPDQAEGIPEKDRKIREALERISEQTLKLLKTIYRAKFLQVLVEHIRSLFAAIGVLILIEFGKTELCDIGINDILSENSEYYDGVCAKCVVTDDLKSMPSAKWPPEKWLRGYAGSIKSAMDIAISLLLPSQPQEDRCLFDKQRIYIRGLRLLHGKDVLVGRDSEKELDEVMMRVRTCLAFPVWESLNKAEDEKSMEQNA